MPDHTIFNERPESQDRALKVIEKLGYTIVPRSEAEKKRGSRRAVLFTEELQSFLSHQTYQFGTEDRFFSRGSIAKAMQTVDQFSAAGLYAENKAIYELLCAGKSMEEDLPDGTRQSFDLSFIDFENPQNNTFQVTDEFEVERSNGKLARPDIVVLVNGIPLVVIECKKSSVDVMEGVNQNIRNWGEEYIPHLFRYTQLVLAVNPDKVLYGTCGTPAKYFVSWHEDNKEWLNDWCRKCSPDGHIKEQDRALVSLLHPELPCLHIGDVGPQALRRPGADVGDPAADLPEVVGLMGGVGGPANHHDLLVPIEHPVAGGAVAHPRAQVLRLTGELSRLHHAGGQHHGTGLLHLAAHGQVKFRPHGQDVQHPAVSALHAHLTGVCLEPLQQLRPRDAEKAQVVVNAAGLVQGVVPGVAADDHHRLAPGPGLHRGGQARRAAAYDRDVVHWYSPSRSPKRAAITAATSGLAIS